jgi:hypothetical protein
MQTRRIAPIIAAILLLLPVLYVGSYLTLIIPGGVMCEPGPEVKCQGRGPYFFRKIYRVGDQRSEWFFWPLEQIDRRLRPDSWPVDSVRS